MSIMLHRWSSTVGGQKVTVLNGNMYVNATHVANVSDHPVTGYVVHLRNHLTVDAPTMEDAGKWAVNSLLESSV